MKTKFALVVFALIATFISYITTRQLEDCPSGCITTQGGFPFNVIRDFIIDDSLALLNFLLWLGFLWLGLELYKRITH